MSSTIQFRRSVAVLWTSINPILNQGELGLELDTNKAKFGDGILRWNALPYAIGPIIESLALTVSLDVGTLPAWTDWESGDFALTGAIVGKPIVVGTPASWPMNALATARTTVPGIVRVRVYNFASPNGAVPIVFSPFDLELRVLP